MRIGELASKCDCPVETIRYYEKTGLLAKPDRAANGYRTYTDQQLKWLQFILRCRRIGLSQNDVRKLVGIEMNTPARCDEVKELLARHLVLLQQKLVELKQMETAVSQLKEKCENGSLDACPAITELLNDS